MATRTISTIEQIYELFGGKANTPNSLIDILKSPFFTGPNAYIIPSSAYKEIQSGLLNLEKQGFGSVSDLALGKGTTSGGGGGSDPLLSALQAQAAALQGQLDAAAAGTELGYAQLEETKRQFDLTLELQKQAQAFQEKDITTQHLLEAAGLATSPQGAIQLAYMARGQGAPNAEIRDIFQNLPFVQALLNGQALPGFGLPEQLGGEGRTAAIGVGGAQASTAGGGAAATQSGQNINTILGQTFGLTLPSRTGITQQQFEGLTDFEKSFLGYLSQAETGQSAQGFLQDVVGSFIPTTSSFGVL